MYTFFWGRLYDPPIGGGLESTTPHLLVAPLVIIDTPLTYCEFLMFPHSSYMHIICSRVCTRLYKSKNLQHMNSVILGNGHGWIPMDTMDTMTISKYYTVARFRSSTVLTLVHTREQMMCISLLPI